VQGILVFCAGMVVSLAASWLLVSRLERLGERAGFSEAWLGLVAALAADTPEITSAVTALARGQASVGAGVIIGSNVFNLAALLGLAAVVAGSIGFHRRVVVLSGVPAVWPGWMNWPTMTAPLMTRSTGPGPASRPGSSAPAPGSTATNRRSRAA
jgi:cation:H+ antiporter